MTRFSTQNPRQPPLETNGSRISRNLGHTLIAHSYALRSWFAAGYFPWRCFKAVRCSLYPSTYRDMLQQPFMTSCLDLRQSSQCLLQVSCRSSKLTALDVGIEVTHVPAALTNS